MFGVLALNRQEYETLKEWLPPDVEIADVHDAVVQGVEKSRLYERKELKDFIASVIDGRIFEQLKELANNSEEYEPFVILEGQGFYDWSQKKWVNLKGYFDAHPERKLAFYEALTAFRAFGVGLVITTGKEDTALFLTHQAAKLGKPKEKKEWPERGGFKRDWSVEKKRGYWMDAFGHETGKVLSHIVFNTLKKALAGDKELEGDYMLRYIADLKTKSGRRIGEKKAKEIYNVLFT